MIDPSRERNATPRPDSAADLAACTCAHLRQAARVVTQAYNAALRPANLNATQFIVLATLAGRAGLPLTRLAEALVMDRTTLTRNLKPLLAAGLVAEAPAADRRVRHIRLTTRGRRAFETALPHWRDAQTRLVTKLGTDRWHRLLGDLDAVVAHAGGP